MTTPACVIGKIIGRSFADRCFQARFWWGDQDPWVVKRRSDFEVADCRRRVRQLRLREARIACCSREAST